MRYYYGLVDKELNKRRLSPLDLTEFDQWVNDATRRDINNIIKRYNVFGLKIWDFEIIEKDGLKNIGNFGVDLIFLEEDRDKVASLINKYKNGEISDREYVNQLFDISFYDCTWV